MPTCAEYVDLSISSLRLQEALRQQSIKDTLTGLYNRRHMYESLERELRRAARSDQPVGLVMFDLDHFKTFNDTYGHECGDTVLRELGKLLSRTARAEDIPCRFGGEEFLLILPCIDLSDARAKAERLRNQVKELTVRHQGTSLGTITISAGVAAFPTHGSLTTELIGAADGALYRAEEEGRDRAVVAQLPHESDAFSASTS
jgi:diguanylate cyclase (GGDEF)-like protein